MTRSVITTADIEAFEIHFDRSREDLAFQSRGEFLRDFPMSKLGGLNVDSYVIGYGHLTFCYYLEVRTNAWAAIKGATAFKFGIYFGRTKSDPSKKYRFADRFGTNKEQAFAEVKAAVLDLVREGSRSEPDFDAIDNNTLSQMFKAKILGLYFPERFLSVCSGEHLRLIAAKVGLPNQLPLSDVQHRLLSVKDDHPITRVWSNPKFLRFLYATYIPKDLKPHTPIKKLRVKTPPKVSFEDMQDQMSRIGKKAEEFALVWEKERLLGANLDHLVTAIDDRRDRPGYGYDFLSHNAERQPRFVEVKSVGRVPEGYRFFLSDNEYTVSCSPEHRGAYYFYLVFFDGAGEPERLLPLLAADLYKHAELEPSSYTVRFDVGHSVEEN